MLLLVGVAVGYVAHQPSQIGPAFANREGGYAFVNPLLTCDISEDQPYPTFADLQNKLETKINSLKRSGDVSRVSVYFRDMNYGVWTGINFDDKYIPASLMKVPLMIAYLKESQSSPAVLTREYAISSSLDANEKEVFKPAHPLAPGRYSVNDLLRAMIRGSDNNAADVLNEQIATSSFENVYNTLGVPGGEENSEYMSPKDYMVIFRVLYNATYLSRSKSQSALELLSTTEFKSGITQGTGSQTVAHKFGERSVYTKDTRGIQTLQKRELHDCGIVYYPRSPYGLCIMTEGADFDRMASAVGDISALVYTQVKGGLLNHQ
jgi:beta-lactamase class A